MVNNLFSLVEFVAGAAFVLVGVASLINKDIMKTHLELFSSNDLSHKALSQLMLIGFLIMGLVIVSVHNEWSMNLGILTTLVGWSMTIKCFLWLAFRDQMQSILKTMKPILQKPLVHFAMGALSIVVGLLMVWDHLTIIV